MKCMFCDIIARKAPADIFWEDDHVIVFHDHFPRAPTHLLICPKEHYADLLHAPPEIMPRLFETVQHVAEKLGTGDDGFRLTVNNGANAGQIVFHLHFHFMTTRRVSKPERS